MSVRGVISTISGAGDALHIGASTMRSFGRMVPTGISTDARTVFSTLFGMRLLVVEIPGAIFSRGFLWTHFREIYAASPTLAPFRRAFF